MIKVLFICYGNICRSPMAEFIFKDKIAALNLSDFFYIASAATSTEEIWNGIGNPVYPPAREELARHGISCEGKRAVLLQKSDYMKYDYLIGMDERNIKNMYQILGGDPEGKIYKLMTFAGSSQDVADPWYSGDFKTTYKDVTMGCEGLIKEILKTYPELEREKN